MKDLIGNYSFSIIPTSIKFDIYITVFLHMTWDKNIVFYSITKFWWMHIWIRYHILWNFIYPYAIYREYLYSLFIVVTGSGKYHCQYENCYC